MYILYYMLKMVYISCTGYFLNDENSQKTVPDDIDAIINLSWTEQNGSRGNKLSLHMFTQLHE